MPFFFDSSKATDDLTCDCAGCTIERAFKDVLIPAHVVIRILSLAASVAFPTEVDENGEVTDVAPLVNHPGALFAIFADSLHDFRDSIGVEADDIVAMLTAVGAPPESLESVRMGFAANELEDNPSGWDDGLTSLLESFTEDALDRAENEAYDEDDA